MKIIAKIENMIFEKLFSSSAAFVDICAKDFNLDCVLFAQQLDALKFHGFIEYKSDSTAFIEMSQMLFSFTNIIEDENTVVSIALTREGESEFIKIRKEATVLSASLGLTNKKRDPSE